MYFKYQSMYKVRLFLNQNFNISFCILTFVHVYMLCISIKLNLAFSILISYLYDVKVKKKIEWLLEFLNIYLFIFVCGFFDRIMDNGLLQRWIFFFMEEDEIALTETPPLVEAFASSTLIMLQSVHLLAVNWNQKKEKESNEWWNLIGITISKWQIKINDILYIHKSLLIN